MLNMYCPTELHFHPTIEGLVEFVLVGRRDRVWCLGEGKREVDLEFSEEKNKAVSWRRQRTEIY
jgi:hypothetical protein